MHQTSCGMPREGYDDYADVREACEHKLKEWERQGILLPWHALSHDWLFSQKR
ncbi:MAG: hypothetical protein WCP06_07355 [Verrucomicrobiota bacterium]